MPTYPYFDNPNRLSREDSQRAEATMYYAGSLFMLSTAAVTAASTQPNVRNAFKHALQSISQSPTLRGRNKFVTASLCGGFLLLNKACYTINRLHEYEQSNLTASPRP